MIFFVLKFISFGAMLELVDKTDSKSCFARSESSILSGATIYLIMTISDDKKKIVDILKGEKKWRVKVFHYFKSTDASVENYLCDSSEDNLPFVEFTLLATDKDDAYKKASKIYQSEFSETADVISVEEEN